MVPTKLAFLLLEKDEGRKENGGSDETWTRNLLRDSASIGQIDLIFHLVLHL